MKNLFGKSLGKSICISLIIFLAIGGFFVFAHATIGEKINQGNLDMMKDCINENSNCPEYRLSDFDDEAKKEFTEEYDMLLKRHNNDKVAATLSYNRYNHFEASVTWFYFYKQIMLSMLISGFIIGISLHLIYRVPKEEMDGKKDTKKEKKNNKKTKKK